MPNTSRIRIKISAQVRWVRKNSCHSQRILRKGIHYLLQTHTHKILTYTLRAVLKFLELKR
jgi:hypothetical protein